MRSSPILLASLVACAACAAPARPAPPLTSAAPAPEAAPPVLYGRDGKPVASVSRGAIAEQDQGGGRLTLLELYQKSCAERDALLDELELVRSDLERTQAALLDAQKSIAGFESENETEQRSREELAAENLDLAARLATAHIRRMEAEKTLLELRLALLESQGAEKAAVGSAEPAPKPAERRP